MKADPIGSILGAMAQAPESDQQVMADPLWRTMFRTALAASFERRESLDGLVEDAMAIFGTWSDVAMHEMRTDLTWWHGAKDNNCPLPAVRRLIEQLPTVTLREMGDVGHFEGYRREAEILDELLSRG